MCLFSKPNNLKNVRSLNGPCPHWPPPTTEVWSPLGKSALVWEASVCEDAWLVEQDNKRFSSRACQLLAATVRVITPGVIRKPRDPQSLQRHLEPCAKHVCEKIRKNVDLLCRTFSKSCKHFVPNIATHVKKWRNMLCKHLQTYNVC